MSYEQFVELLNRCMIEVAGMQQEYLASVASRADAKLEDVKFEAGRLRGIGDFAAYIAFAAKKQNEEENS